MPATIRKSHALAMFVISEAEAAAIRATYDANAEAADRLWQELVRRVKAAKPD